jgi:hypothetical protein
MPRWTIENKTGTIRKDGYRLITVNRKRIFEHRHIIEQSIGRKLTFDETIHHINHKRSDNRIENLQLISRSEHSHKFPAFRNGTIEMNCKKCKNRFISFKSDKRSGYCSKKCWYTRNK